MDAVAADTGVSRPADPFAPAASSRIVRTSRRSATWALSAELNFGPSFGKITSITAWRNFESTIGQDADYSTGDVLWRKPTDRTATSSINSSEELRFSGETDRLDWLVGAFYAAEDLDSDLNLRYGADFETYYSLVLSAGMAPTLVNALTGLPAQTAYPAGAGYQDRFEQRSDTFAAVHEQHVPLHGTPARHDRLALHE